MEGRICFILSILDTDGRGKFLEIADEKRIPLRFKGNGVISVLKKYADIIITQLQEAGIEFTTFTEEVEKVPPLN